LNTKELFIKALKMMTTKEKYKKYITKFTLKMTSAEFDLG